MNLSEENSTKLGDGILSESLSRSPKQIRIDRGQDLAENLETKYRRRYEDVVDEIKKLYSKQRRMFDFGGDSTTSLVVKEVDEDAIFEADMAIVEAIRIKTIDKENIAKRYNELIGKPLTEI